MTLCSYNLLEEGYNQEFGYCLAGFSSTATRSTAKTPIFFVGAPGSIHNKGTVWVLCESNSVL